MRSINKLIAAIALIFSAQAFGAGFEKTTTFSAENAALSNATTSVVQGADAVLFNPAGLVRGPDREYSFNLSPAFSTFTGPTNVNDTSSSTGDQQISPLFGILSKYKLTEQLSLGYGIFSVGGTAVDHGTLDFSGSAGYTGVTAANGVKFTSDLKILEFTAAAGYAINEQFSVGLGWRASFVSADYESYSPGTGPATITDVKLEGLKAQDFGGFRLGAQYDGGKWGAGFTYRTKVEFTAKGDATTETFLGANGATVVASATDDVEAENVLPSAFDLAFHYDIDEATRVFVGYTQHNYSENEQFDLTSAGAFAASSGVATIPQDWENSEVYKLAVEDKGWA